MVTAVTDQKIQPSNANLASDAGGIASLISLLLGTPAKTTTTSGGTTTKQTMFDSTAVDALIQQLLGASGLQGQGRTGLAATAGMQKGAGLYNSSTQTLLNNDLMSRITGEISIAGAPTVQTNPSTTSKTQQAGLMGSLSSLAMPLALLSMTSGGKKMMKGAMSGFDSITDTIASAMGFGNPVSGGGIDAGLGTGIEGVASADMAAGLLPASTLADMGASTGAVAGASSPFTAEAYGAASVGAGAGMSATAADTALAGFDAAVGGSAGLDAVFSGVAADAAIGAGAEAAGGFALSDLLPALAACFITTAIMKASGSTDDNGPELTILRHYRDTWLTANHPEDIAEYYRTAPAIVDRINTLPKAKELWHKLHLIYLAPALLEIESGNNEAAYKIYKQMVIAAKEIQ